MVRGVQGSYGGGRYVDRGGGNGMKRSGYVVNGGYRGHVVNGGHMVNGCDMVNGGHVVNGRRYRVVRGSDFLYDSVETIDVVGGVLNEPDGAIGLDETVMSLNDVTVSLFILFLDVTGMRIVDSVVKSVPGVRL